MDSINFTVSTQFSSRTVEIKQRTVGPMQPIPIEYLDGYISPSGGYMNCARYRVKAKNPSTNRFNSRVYECGSEVEAVVKAQLDGMKEPITAEAVPFDSPTERQIAYAHDLEILMPDGICKDDLSALISRVTEDDELPPDEWTVKNAIRAGVHFSRFVGAKALRSMITQQILTAKRKRL